MKLNQAKGLWSHFICFSFCPPTPKKPKKKEKNDLALLLIAFLPLTEWSSAELVLIHHRVSWNHIKPVCEPVIGCYFTSAVVIVKQLTISNTNTSSQISHTINLCCCTSSFHCYKFLAPPYLGEGEEEDDDEEEEGVPPWIVLKTWQKLLKL